jgi:valyl-tRNA synthetase
MSIDSSYKPQNVEKKWYDYWSKHNFFHSEINEKPSYTIVIPPPNVTGVLHMGHMLNNTIQDVLIRRARLKGFNACWVPGTDHASIATEAKVVAKLKSEGIKKSDLSREEFLKHAWDWTEEYGGKILGQLKRLGASCDWERLKFTMDDDMYESVIQVFIDLYNKGLIYRGYRMVNWDPEAKTTLSDEEVIYEEKQGLLYYVEYPIVDGDEKITIATTRPETIFGDSAICINPNDERFSHLKGKKALVPIVNREVPIIFDDYVDMEFGTGCLKITPAHDENDKAIGERHNLEIIDIFNDDATLNSHGLKHQGKERFEARKDFANELKAEGFLSKTEDYTNKIGLSERTKAVIEPKLSEQWFLKMKDLAKPALDAVMKDENIKLFPSKFKNTYKHWLENVRDWNISRQLWWGHQIPVFYLINGDGADLNKFVVAKNIEEAVNLAQDKFEDDSITASDLIQDEDSLDTWFSSWLWPMSVFDGIRYPDNKEFQYYYPTKDLVTGPDILFFWVARMIMAGYEFEDQKPFDNVYLTGLVRDKQRRKMSKSLGNSPDAIGLIDEFGADGVRVGLLLSSAAGNDLLFDEALCQQGKSFANKIWNAYRLIDSWEVDDKLEQPGYAKIGIEWYNYKFQQNLLEIEDHYEKYRISDVLMNCYKLVWNDFCSWLLETLKPAYQQPVDAKTKAECIRLFEDNLKILHPFMPFITEELWQSINSRTPEEALIVSPWPESKPIDEDFIKQFELTTEVITHIRSIRKEKNIPFKTSIDLKIENKENFPSKFNCIITKLGHVDQLTYVDEQQDASLSFSVKSNVYYIPVEGSIDIEAEMEKLKKDLDYYTGFLVSVEKKLQNKRFVDNAPEQVVHKEKQKQADALAKIESIKESIDNLKT